jgi:hypothetical protein
MHSDRCSGGGLPNALTISVQLTFSFRFISRFNPSCHVAGYPVIGNVCNSTICRCVAHHFCSLHACIRTTFRESISWSNDHGMRNTLSYNTHRHHHHHMALQSNSGPGLPFCCFVTITFLQGWIVSPAPNPQPGGPGLRIYDPRRQGGPAIPPGTGYPF